MKEEKKVEHPEKSDAPIFIHARHRTFVLDPKAMDVTYIEVNVTSYFDEISQYNPVLSRKKITDFDILKYRDVSKYIQNGVITPGVDYIGLLRWKGSAKTFVIKNGELFVYKGVLIRQFENEFVCQTKMEQFVNEFPAYSKEDNREK